MFNRKIIDNNYRIAHLNNYAKANNDRTFNLLLLGRGTQRMKQIQMT